MASKSVDEIEKECEERLDPIDIPIPQTTPMVSGIDSEGMDPSHSSLRWCTPVCINTCSIDQLLKIPGVGKKTAITILSLRDNLGSISEADFYNKIRSPERLAPYFTFEPALTHTVRNDPYKKGEVPQRGYSSKSFCSPRAQSQNVHPRANSRDHSAGALHEKMHPYGTFSLSQDHESCRDSDFPVRRPKPEYEDDELINERRRHRDRFFEEFKDMSIRNRPSKGGRSYTRERTPSPPRQMFSRHPPGRDSFSRAGDRTWDDRQIPPPMPRSISFDGKESWQACRCKFMAYVGGHNLRDREMRDQLCWCLSGKASEFYSNLIHRDPDLSFIELMERLERRFDMRDLPETSQMLFQTAAQKQKETVVEWAERIMGLAMDAYPELNDTHVYRQAVMRFCQGLSDKEAGHYGLMSRPKSMDEALDRVRWYQHTDQVMYSGTRSVRQTAVEQSRQDSEDEEYNVRRTGMRYPAPSRQKPSSLTEKKVQFSPSKEEGRTRALEDKVEHLQEQLTEVLGQLKVVTESLEGLKGMMKSLRSRSPAPRPKSPSGCFRCGNPGHFARECPQPRESKASISKIEDLGNYSGSEM